MARRGRRPIGKRAMTVAERVRRYRLLHATVTKPAAAVTKQASTAALARITELEQLNAALVTELAQARAELAELEREHAVADRITTNMLARIAELESAETRLGPTADVAALMRRITEAERERDTALAERTSLHKMLDDGHRVIAQAKAILAAKAFVPAEVFKTLLHSAHEDRVTDPKSKVRYRTAFQFLKEHERMLAKKPPPPRPAGLPRTPEEWEAAKWHAKEERKAKRAAKKAAKNPKRLK
jgi:chromosome segregation ATPase